MMRAKGDRNTDSVTCVERVMRCGLQSGMGGGAFAVGKKGSVIQLWGVSWYTFFHIDNSVLACLVLLLDPTYVGTASCGCVDWF